jgi:hypothetical protein
MESLPNKKKLKRWGKDALGVVKRNKKTTAVVGLATVGTLGYLAKRHMDNQGGDKEKERLFKMKQLREKIKHVNRPGFFRRMGPETKETKIADLTKDLKDLKALQSWQEWFSGVDPTVEPTHAFGRRRRSRRSRRRSRRSRRGSKRRSRHRSRRSKRSNRSRRGSRR